ncbi:unnamed protein product [Bursaphelenchus xylophilus]|uniref:NADH-cytochrome b5 reductase n=1 Tax=Bursaphelenchus xylophilus TaxID=6326 RepID=A0A1I7RWX5_BURXY|nr:unnamed protein product [Bursaphelenchus xylophilus]CAG9121181.1 unnamed protein product [Bursaphelenchus xylophilus]
MENIENFGKIGKKRPQLIETFHDLTRTTRIPLKLVQKSSISKNTRIFRFALPSPSHISGLEPGHHVRISNRVNDKCCGRLYTPISDDELVGFIDVLVKIYEKSEAFPSGGFFSQYLDNLRIGDIMNFRGPIYRHMYHGNGYFTSGHAVNEAEEILQHHLYKRMNLIAGGTGITPIWRIINKTLKNPFDETQIRLLFANRTEDDILLRSDLERLQRQHPQRFRLTHVLSQPAAERPWAGHIGHINTDLIDIACFPPDDCTGFIVCGPRAMTENAVLPALEELEVDDEHIIVM